MFRCEIFKAMLIMKQMYFDTLSHRPYCIDSVVRREFILAKLLQICNSLSFYVTIKWAFLF